MKKIIVLFFATLVFESIGLLYCCSAFPEQGEESPKLGKQKPAVPGCALPVAAKSPELNLSSEDTQFTNMSEISQFKSVYVLERSRLWLTCVGSGAAILVDNKIDRSLFRNSRVRTVQAAYFLDNQTGWLIDFEGILWETSNSGRDWKQKAVVRGSRNRPNAQMPFAELVFLNSSVGWASTGLELFKTSDGGGSWQQIDRGQDSRFLLSGNSHSGVFIVIENSPTHSTLVWLSDDRQTVHQLPENIIRGSIEFVNSRVGWAGTDEGKIYSTKDGGISWKEAASFADLIPTSIFWVSKSNGFAAGYRNVQNKDRTRDRSALAKVTRDGGKTWTNIEGIDAPFFSRVVFYDQKVGWLIGRDRIFRTLDGGEKWEEVLRLRTIKQR